MRDNINTTQSQDLRDLENVLFKENEFMCTSQSWACIYKYGYFQLFAVFCIFSYPWAESKRVVS